MKKGLIIGGVIVGAGIANYFITKHCGRTFFWMKPKVDVPVEVAKEVAAAATSGVDGFNNAVAEQTGIFRRNGFNKGVMAPPVARIKPWGGKVEGGQKMCFDEASNKYVPCGPAPVKKTN